MKKVVDKRLENMVEMRDADMELYTAYAVMISDKIFIIEKHADGSLYQAKYRQDDRANAVCFRPRKPMAHKHLMRKATNADIMALPSKH